MSDTDRRNVSAEMKLPLALQRLWRYTTASSHLIGTHPILRDRGCHRQRRDMDLSLYSRSWHASRRRVICDSRGERAAILQRWDDESTAIGSVRGCVCVGVRSVFFFCLPHVRVMYLTRRWRTISPLHAPVFFQRAVSNFPFGDRGSTSVPLITTQPVN